MASAASDLMAGAPSIRNGPRTTRKGGAGLMHFRRLQASCVGSRYEVGRSRGRVGCPNVLVRKSGSRVPEPLHSWAGCLVMLQPAQTARDSFEHATGDRDVGVE